MSKETTAPRRRSEPVYGCALCMSRHLMDQVHSIKEDQGLQQTHSPTSEARYRKAKSEWVGGFLDTLLLCDLAGRGLHSILLRQQDE